MLLAYSPEKPRSFTDFFATYFREGSVPEWRIGIEGMRFAPLLLVPIAFAVTAERASACEVVVSGEAAGAWQAALEALDETASDDSDCAEITLEVVGTRARLVFRTSDGRTTERVLDDPSELVPSVQALRVTVPASTPKAEPAPAEEEEPRMRIPPQRDSLPLARGKADLPNDAPGIFGFQIGGRGGAGSLVSPMLRGYGAIVLDRWELALVGGYDARYHSVAEPPRPAKGSAAVIGIGVGRYEPVRSFALTGGGRVFLAVLENEDESKDEKGQAEVRTGAYLGLVFPRLARTRFRADFNAEIVPQNMEATYGAADATSFTPWWAIGWSVGVEMGGT